MVRGPAPRRVLELLPAQERVPHQVPGLVLEQPLEQGQGRVPQLELLPAQERVPPPEPRRGPRPEPGPLRGSGRSQPAGGRRCPESHPAPARAQRLGRRRTDSLHSPDSSNPMASSCFRRTPWPLP
jgi:hypothetical protein